MFEICLFLYCDAPKYAVRTAKEFGCMLKPNASLDQSMILWLIPVVAAHVDFTSIYIKILIIIIHIYHEIIWNHKWNDLPDQNQYWRMWRVEPMGPIDQTWLSKCKVTNQLPFHQVAKPTPTTQKALRVLVTQWSKVATQEPTWHLLWP